MKYKETPDITLKMILAAGIIEAGTKVYARSCMDIEGLINSDGGIILKIGSGEVLYPYPSGAARAITKSSVNGWIFWMIKIGNKFQELRVIRDLYRKQVEN